MSERKVLNVRKLVLSISPYILIFSTPKFPCKKGSVIAYQSLKRYWSRNLMTFVTCNKGEMSRFINIHKLRCRMIHNYCYYTIKVFVKVLKVLVNNREITLCIPKLR